MLILEQGIAKYSMSSSKQTVTVETAFCGPLFEPLLLAIFSLDMQERGPLTYLHDVTADLSHYWSNESYTNSLYHHSNVSFKVKMNAVVWRFLQLAVMTRT